MQAHTEKCEITCQGFAAYEQSDEYTRIVRYHALCAVAQSALRPLKAKDEGGEGLLDQARKCPAVINTVLPATFALLLNGDC